MRRAPRIAIIVVVSALAAIVVLFLAVIIAVRTPWVRGAAREYLIAYIEKSTGGRAEVGELSLAPDRLSAEMSDFVLHGTEPAGAPPLFRARLVRVGLKPGAALKQKLELRYLLIEQPQIHLRVRPDGSTNLPQPPVPGAPGGEPPLKTVMAIAIARFQAADGLLVVADRKVPLDLRGENVRAQLVYHSAAPRYTGAISSAPMYVATGGNPALPLTVDIPLEVAGDALTITNARLDAPASRLQASVRLTSLSVPRGSVRLSGRLALPELARSFRSSLVAKTRGTPPVNVNAAASLEGNRAQIESLNLVMGSSSLEATGALASMQSFTGSFQFSGDFTMEELRTLLNLPSLGTGTVHVTGTATTGPKGIDVKAHFSARNVALNAGKTRLTGVGLSSDVSVVSGRVSLTDIRIGALGGTFTGSAEIVNKNRFVVDGALQGVDLRQAAAAYGASQFAWSGAVSGPVHAEGSLAGPFASQLIAGARLGIAPRAGGQPVNGLFDVAYNGPNNTISFGNSFLALPSTRVEFSGALGNRLRIRAASRDLNDLLPALAVISGSAPQPLPVELANGEATFDGTVTGSITNPRIDGRVALTNFVVNREKLDRFAATVAVASNGAAISNAVLTQRQLEANLDASIGLVNWKPQPASPIVGAASVRNAPVESLLAAAGLPAMPVTGILFANVKLAGTVGDPRAGLGILLKNGTFYGESFETVQARAVYAATTLQLTSAQITGPYGRLQASAIFRHPPGDFSTGRLEFHAASSPLELSRIRAVSARQPGLSGVIEIKADGAGTLRPAAGPLPFLPSRLDAQVAARSLTINGQPAGGLLLTAETRGSDLVLALRSDIAGSDIRGNGTWQLAGDYPIQARLTFSHVTLGAIARLASIPPGSAAQDISGVIAGALTVSGPVFRPADLASTLQLSQVELRPPARMQPAGQTRPYVLRNAGPLVVTLSQSVLRLQQARLVGPSTDLTLAGAIYLNRGNGLDVRASGRIGLELAESFSPNVRSAGAVLLNAAVQGTFSKPDVNGRLELQNASLNVVDFPNGISNANGVVLFSSTQAVIEKVTGEMGGGKVALEGAVHYGGTVPDFRLQAAGDEVRIDYPEQVSTKVNAKLALAGTSNSSVLSGDVSVLEMILRTNTDIGTLLSPGGPPPIVKAAQTGLLGGVRLDVRIATAPDVQFYTELAQNLQAEGKLQVRGAPGQPGMLGRVSITEGEIVFFGNKFAINRGTISFYDPQQIKPVVDVALETKANGITVTLMLSGPADRLKLTYSSDPPLLFSDVVGLLTIGRTPTSDPVLAARLPEQPQQTVQQVGASALLGQAIANPVAGRLQRLFGISRLSISPQIVGTANTPQAQVALEQQITRNFSFSFIQSLNEANPQIIRAEWAIDPRWSAVAVRQQDGHLGIDLYYKKNFR